MSSGPQRARDDEESIAYAHSLKNIKNLVSNPPRLLSSLEDIHRDLLWLEKRDLRLTRSEHDTLSDVIKELTSMLRGE